MSVQQQASPASRLATVRSLLFVSANRPDRYSKALGSGAGAVVVDLEDAVPPAAKVEARRALAGWLSEKHPVVVRINGADTPWFEADVDMVTGAMPRAVAGVMLPKATDWAQVAELAKRGLAVLPIIETAQGYAAAQALARAPGVVRLVFGSLDFQLDLGIEGEGDALLAFRSGLVLASRLADLPPPIDGVVTALDDPAEVRAQATYARNLGFGAKICIHPSQVPFVHDAFRPSEAEIGWATRLLSAVAVSDGGAVAIDGKMVDRPVILKAEGILARR